MSLEHRMTDIAALPARLVLLEMSLPMQDLNCNTEDMRILLLGAVYVGNLAPNATDEELRELFQIYGVVLEVKMYRKGSYAFVNFQTHDEAVKAIVSLNGQVSFAHLSFLLSLSLSHILYKLV